MREISIPSGAETYEEFRIVKVSDGSTWRPALLEAWIRTPDGWACRLRTSGHRAVGGRTTHARTVLFDPERIRLLTVDDLNPPRPGA